MYNELSDFCHANFLAAWNDPSKTSFHEELHASTTQKTHSTMENLSSDELSSEASHSDDLTGYNLRRRMSQDTRKRAGTKSIRKGPNKQPKLRLSSMSTKSLTKHLHHVKKRLNGTTYDSHLSLRVVHAACSLQMEYLEAKSKNSGGRNGPPPPKVWDRVCKLFGVSSPTYSNIINKYLLSDEYHRTAYESAGKGNSERKDTRIPNTKQVVLEIRTFVRNERAQHKRVTGKQVLEFCINKGYIVIPKDDIGVYKKKEYATAYRTMRRWLERNNYKRGKRSGNIKMKEHVAIKRDLYLSVFLLIKLYQHKRN